MWFTQTMGYVHKEIASPFITVQKDEGIHPAAKSLHFLFKLSQSLFQYNTNTILSRFTMLSFIGEIQWENPMVNPIPWVHKTIGQHTSQKKFLGALPLNPKVGGRSVQYTWGTNTIE